jgi:hypothetical protein
MSNWQNFRSQWQQIRSDFSRYLENLTSISLSLVSSPCPIPNLIVHLIDEVGILKIIGQK